MSRSYRKPYATIMGKGSDRYDKKTASRGLRRVNKELLRKEGESHELSVHKLVGPNGDVWGWHSDGPKSYRGPGRRRFDPDWHDYLCRK